MIHSIITIILQNQILELASILHRLLATYTKPPNILPYLWKAEVEATLEILI